MTIFAVVLQIIIALGIVNVWIFRYNSASPYRPGNAQNMVEEFRAYRLPDWLRSVTGVTKLTLAALLVIGIWYTPLAAPAALGMALLMAGAIGAHVRVGDPIKKSVPAFSMLLSSIVVAYAYMA